MKNIKFILLLLINNIGSSLFSQQAYEIPEIKTPESYSFQKYGNIPINMYTGSIDLAIPILNQNNINILLSYDSSGFIPHKKSGIAGTNWSLIAGGRITRKMNYIPDEYIGNPLVGPSPFGSGLNLHGFLTGVRIHPYTNDQVFDLNSGAGSKDYGGINWYLGEDVANGYEGEPDEFSFNIMNLSGKFIIGNNGIPLVESNDPMLKVDISGLQTYGTRGECIPPDSEIILTDGEGNKYYFGGDFSKFEISYYIQEDPVLSHSQYEGFTYISSFSISKIIFANGKTIDFTYEEGTLDEFFCTMLSATKSNIMANAKLFSMESFSYDGSNINEWKNCPSGPDLCISYLSASPTSNTSYALLKKSLLKSISYENMLVEINYKDVGYTIKHSQTNTSNTFFVNEYVIDNILVKSNNQILLTNTFSYIDKGVEGFKRPFLESVKEEETNKITRFEYYNSDILPPYYTKGIDHWGFWTGLDDNQSLTPLETYNVTTGDYTLNNTFRDANLSKYDVGLLKKVIYPTGGYTEFVYEPQNYSKRIERISSSKFLPILTNNSGYIGGARIKKQISYTSLGIVSAQKEYKYTTTIDGDISSGILMNWPRYLYYFEFTYQGSISKLIVRTSSNVQENSLDSYNIGYSKVFEIENNNGYSEYTFSNYESHPDSIYPEANNTLNYFTGIGQASPLELYKNFRNLYGIDKSNLRGKILNKKVFSEGGNLLREQIFNYSDNININDNTNIDDNNFVSIQHLTGSYVQSYRKFLNYPKLLSEITIDSLNHSSISNTTSYFYNSPNHIQLTSQISTDSNLESIESKYYYAQDLNTSCLINNHMIGIPLKTETYRNGEKLSEQVTEYAQDATTGNLCLPKYIYTKKGDEISIQPERKITYDLYDDKGNLKQYTLENGVPVSIVWGYNQTQPIAKIEGKTYDSLSSSEVLAAINASDADDDRSTDTSGHEGALRTALKTIQDNPALANAMMTYFTYDPLIGVTSITDPKGDTQYYIYDEFNRLKQVIDKDGNILSENQYHYRGN